MRASLTIPGTLVLVLSASELSLAATPAYRNLILRDQPVVYFELDEAEGTTAANSASTGATYEGTFDTAGGPITVNQASFPQGGTSYEFGGGFLGAASALAESLDEWTVEAWINYDSAKNSASNFLSNDQVGWNDDVLFGIGAEGGGQGVESGNVGLIQQGSPGTTRDFVQLPLTADEWHHVLVTGSTANGEIRLYVDGEFADADTDLLNDATFNGADGIGAANLTIGAARPIFTDGGYRPFDGFLDEVAIYDRVLDDATILQHYEFGAGLAGSGEIVISRFTPIGDGLWEVTLEGAPETSYEFRTSEVLDFSPGTLVEELTQGDASDPGTVSGLANAAVVTDPEGVAMVQLPLAGPASFLRAQAVSGP